MKLAGPRGFCRDIRGSVLGAAAVIAYDGALAGTCLLAWLVCPVWFLVSLARNAIERPGWGRALVRIAIPALTFWLIRVNSDYQLGVAEANARRVIAACEEYRAANGRLPETLDELVPRYLGSVPRAKYCVMWDRYFYIPRASLLSWHVVPPHLRKIYNFETRSWSYLD